MYQSNQQERNSLTVRLVERKVTKFSDSIFSFFFKNGKKRKSSGNKVIKIEKKTHLFSVSPYASLNFKLMRKQNLFLHP